MFSSKVSEKGIMNTDNVSCVETKTSEVAFLTPKGEEEVEIVSQTKLESFLEYLLIFFIILEFNTAYLELELLKKVFLNGSVLITLFLFLRQNKSFKFDGTLIIYFLGSFLPLLNVYPGSEKYYIKLFWVILPVFILYFSSLRRIGFDRIILFLLKYSNIVIILALISLVYWTLGSTLGIIEPTMYVPNTWGRILHLIPTYHFLYFETQETSFMGYETVRNSGIFNEGPMYNMILCTALSMELFLRPIKSIWRITILGITTVTTFTTTGILFLGLIGAWIVFNFFSEKTRIVLIAVLPLLAIAIMNFSSAVLEDKESSNGESSVKSRTTDILTCIDIGMENPIVGQGLFTKKAGELEGGTYGYSNSLFTLFADGGLYTVFLYVGALVLIPLRYYSNQRRNLWPLMMLSFFLVFVFTVSPYNLLTLLLMAFGISMYSKQYS